MTVTTTAEPKYRRLGQIVVLLYALASLSGCATILGIEEARCDPDKDESCPGAVVGDDDTADDDADDDSIDDDSIDDDSDDEDDDVIGADDDVDDDDGGARDDDDVSVDDDDDGADDDDDGADDDDDGADDDDDGADDDGADDDVSDDEDDDGAGGSGGTDDDGVGGNPDADDDETGGGPDAGDGEPDVAEPDAATLKHEKCVDLCTTQDVCEVFAPQYQDRAACLLVCDNFYRSGAESGDNSVECRLAQAQSARSLVLNGESAEARFSCEGAGVVGRYACGDLCENLCSFTRAACDDEELTVTRYSERFASDAECEAECNEMVGELNPAEPFMFGAPVGDTLQCRAYHAYNAAAINPNPHCLHALGIELCAP